MRLDSVELTGFRNYRHRVFEFDGGTTVLVGPNTVGKTNVLEGIYLLARGEGFREGKIEEMVSWGSEVGHVFGRVQQTSISRDKKVESVELQVTLTRGMVQGKRVSKRRYLVNGVGRRSDKFVGNLVVVVFRPEDLRIIEGSPGRRRRFLDGVLVQVDGEYGRALASYNRGLRRRNKVLEMIREGRTSRNALTFWDQLVVKNGEYIQQERRDLVEFFSRGFEVEDLRFKKSGRMLLERLRVVYEPSVMSEKRLKQYEVQEVAAGHTLVGPHRDDFRVIAESSKFLPDRPTGEVLDFKKEGRDLAVYGSRGEQRLGVLWLKMMSLEYARNKLEVRPVLLLDDIFSELDREHREMVMGLCRRQQTVVTMTEEAFVASFGKGAKFIKLGG